LTTRPTEVEVGTTIQQVWGVAHRDPDTYRLLAHLVDLCVWLLDETDTSWDASAFGHGASEVHVFGTTGGDLEGRLHDPLLRELRRLKRKWRADLRETGHRWADDASGVSAAADPEYHNIGTTGNTGMA
jgi:hypothetical protein